MKLCVFKLWIVFWFYAWFVTFHFLQRNLKNLGHIAFFITAFSFLFFFFSLSVLVYTLYISNLSLKNVLSQWEMITPQHILQSLFEADKELLSSFTVKQPLFQSVKTVYSKYISRIRRIIMEPDYDFVQRNITFSLWKTECTKIYFIFLRVKLQITLKQNPL